MDKFQQMPTELQDQIQEDMNYGKHWNPHERTAWDFSIEKSLLIVLKEFS